MDILPDAFAYHAGHDSKQDRYSAETLIQAPAKFIPFCWQTAPANRQGGRRWFWSLRNIPLLSSKDNLHTYLQQTYAVLDEKTREEKRANEDDERSILAAFQRYLSETSGSGIWVDWINRYRQNALIVLIGIVLTAVLALLSFPGLLGINLANAAQTAVAELHPSSTPTVTQTPTVTNTPTPTLTPTITNTPTRTTAPSLTPSQTPSLTPTPNSTQNFLATTRPTANPSFAPTVRTKPDSSQQVWVPPGSFAAGDQAGFGGPEEAPHQVYTDGFWIDRYLVTNGRFAQCPASVCGAPANNVSHKRPDGYYGVPDYRNYPVMQVTWYQAQEYCHWNGGQLPTEAEFEKAAGWDPRTGATRLYPWGSAPPDHERYANFNHVDIDTTAVDVYPQGASAVGAFDMAGNLWEWIADWYSDSYYATNTSWINPTGPATGTQKGLRGGSWYTTNILELRVSNRGFALPIKPANEFGFRCVFEK